MLHISHHFQIVAIYLEGISHAYAVCVQVWIQVNYSGINIAAQCTHQSFSRFDSGYCKQ